MLWENFPPMSRRTRRQALRDSLICIIYARKSCIRFPPRRRSIRNISLESTGPYVKKLVANTIPRIWRTLISRRNIKPGKRRPALGLCPVATPLPLQPVRLRRTYGSLHYGIEWYYSTTWPVPTYRLFHVPCRRSQGAEQTTPRAGTTPAPLRGVLLPARLRAACGTLLLIKSYLLMITQSGLPAHVRQHRSQRGLWVGSSHRPESLIGHVVWTLHSEWHQAGSPTHAHFKQKLAEEPE